jgi:transcriptional regulator with XRE-family HTH domain
MNIGPRLKTLREARSLSQGDIEKRTGLMRCYVSRVEKGHTVPSLSTLERWTEALEIELYQLFFEGNGGPKAVPVVATDGLNNTELQLLELFRQTDKEGRQLILSVASKMTVRKA